MIDGGNIPVELVEGLLSQVGCEGVAIERNVFQFALLKEGSDATAMGYDACTNATKLVVGKFEHTSQTAQGTMVLYWCLDVELIAQVMLYV